MGTWGAGIFEGDGPLDAIGELTDWLEQQLSEAGDRDPSPAGSARLAAAIGLCLQLSPYTFEQDGEAIRAALGKHDEVLKEILSADGLGLLERVAAGEAEDVCGELRDARRQSGSPDVEALAGGFGIPAPGLLDLPVAKELAQQLADRCAAAVDAGLGEEDLDLYEVDFMGAFGLLVLIEPCTVDPERVGRWRQGMQQIYAQQRQEQDDGDMGHFSEYMENVEKAFEIALEKFG